MEPGVVETTATTAAASVKSPQLGRPIDASEDRHGVVVVRHIDNNKPKTNKDFIYSVYPRKNKVNICMYLNRIKL